MYNSTLYTRIIGENVLKALRSVFNQNCLFQDGKYLGPLYPHSIPGVCIKISNFESKKGHLGSFWKK